MERMKQKYVTECIPFMQKEFKYKNKMEVPQLSKIVVNMGVGAAIDDVKLVDNAAVDLQKITGQKPVVTRSKKAIAAFKLKQGVPIGCVVTLRKKRMYEFFDRLVNVALPRLRDFNGVSDKGFDRNGNYTMGLKEQTIFPEIDIEHVQKAVGMNITIVTTAKTDEEARAMLKVMGMPFRKNTAKQ